MRYASKTSLWFSLVGADFCFVIFALRGDLQRSLFARYLMRSERYRNLFKAFSTFQYTSTIFKETFMSEKTESANLILKLYELRRDPVMREARNWFARFDPQSANDVMQAVMGEHSAHFRMVASYWDMAASFVNHAAIDREMFNDANAEHVFVFSKIEPFVDELRQIIGSPNAWKNLEQVVMQMPDAKERLAAMRERSKRMAQMRSETATHASQQDAANT